MGRSNGTAKDQARLHQIVNRLIESNPDAKCELNFKTPFQLLIATILSAQCTDKRVNLVTKDLFKKYKSPKDFVEVDPEKLQNAIRSTGFFRNKTKSIKAACKMLLENYKGRVPRSMDELTELPGIARKTANVILGTAFNIASGVVVDTHVLRVARRLGFSAQKTPDKVEQDLMRIVPQDKWIAFSHNMVLHGRYVCLARKPKCYACVLYDLCESRDKIPMH